MSEPTSPTYKATNWTAYNEAVKRRGSLTIWFDPEMNWGAEPSGKRGRFRTFSDAAIQTCLSMKVLFGMALRQTTGFVEKPLAADGAGLGRAGFQHLVPPSEDTCGEHPVSRLERPAAPAQPDSARSGDWQRDRGWSIRHAQMPQRHRQERRAPRIKISGSGTLAELERIPPKKPRRDNPPGIMLRITLPGDGCIA